MYVEALVKPRSISIMSFEMQPSVQAETVT